MRIKIGAQIYTLRNEITTPEAVRPAFEFLKSVGCEVVELAAMPNIKATEVAKISQDVGIEICSTHSPYERIKNDFYKLIDEHLIYGSSIIGLGSMPKEYNPKFLHDIELFADFLNDCANRLASRKMSIMYHNHDFEFKKLEGKRILDILLERTSENVLFSLDVYWAHIAGVDVEEYIDKMGSRLAVMHLKDYKHTIMHIGNTMGAPGDGILDFKSFLQKAQANGTPYAVVEVDKTSDPRDAIKRGIKFISEIY